MMRETHLHLRFFSFRVFSLFSETIPALSLLDPNKIRVVLMHYSIIMSSTSL